MIVKKLARWHTKLNKWQTFGMLACKNEKLAFVWHVATWAHKPRWHAQNAQYVI